MCEESLPVTFDADSFNCGKIVRCIVGDHNNRVTDLTAIIIESNLERNSSIEFTEEISDNSNCSEQCESVVKIMKDNFVTQCMDAGFYDTHENVSPTLLARTYKDPHIICKINISEGNDVMNKEIEDFISDNNRNIDHQQDILHSHDSKMSALCAATHGAGPHLTKTVINSNRKYVVRRLTPKECCRLQGFPDWWENDLVDKNPTEETMEFWRKVFNTYSESFGKKRKTDNQIRKWLASEPADTDRYKMWGNGVSLCTVVDTLWRINYFVEHENDEGFISLEVHT